MKRTEALTWLNLTEPFTAEELTAAYRAACKAAHPDAGGSATQFHDVKLAYDALKGSNTAQPQPSASMICPDCRGAGKVAKPSRRLGGKPLEIRCRKCGGVGLR